MTSFRDERRGRRQQAVWVGFVVLAVAFTRVGSHLHLQMESFKAIYVALSITALLIGLLCYRLDVADDLPKTKSAETGFKPSSWLQRSLLILLAIGLAEAIWFIRRESFWLVLILPVNAMWIWTSYIADLQIRARTRQSSGQ